MSHDKNQWIARYLLQHAFMAPNAPTGQLNEIAETYWFYLRHREPEDVATDRVLCRLQPHSREDAWVYACTQAICELDDTLARQDAQALAVRLWDADISRVVDPYLMATALWEQAALLSAQDPAFSAHPLAFVLPGRAGPPR